MPVTMQREWFGDELEARINRAAGRAIVAIGMQIAVETKTITHRITGTLARSVHAAPAGYEGYAEDDTTAPTADLLLLYGVPTATPTPFGPSVEVGSWLPYACVEWIGRGHPGVTQGLEMARGARMDATVVEAFRQEGL
jgi:hypothetical protein